MSLSSMTLHLPLHPFQWWKTAQTCTEENDRGDAETFARSKGSSDSCTPDPIRVPNSSSANDQIHFICMNIKSVEHSTQFYPPRQYPHPSGSPLPSTVSQHVSYGTIRAGCVRSAPQPQRTHCRQVSPSRAPR